MNRLSPLLIAVLVVGMIATAPRADAQVEPVPPPTPEQVRAEQEVMRERAEMQERSIAELEARLPRVRDAEVRADVERQIRDLRERRAAVDQDLAALETVAPEAFHDRRRAVDEQFRDVERRTAEAQLRAAHTPADFRRAARTQIDMQRRYLDAQHQRLAALPDEERAQAAYALIQVRRQYDDLYRRHLRMERIPTAELEARRADFTRDLTELHTELHRTDFEWRMHPDVVAGR